MKKFRQTLIWEFMKKETLRPIDKLKVLVRIKHKLYFKQDRTYTLLKKIKKNLTNSQLKYYENNVSRCAENMITVTQYLRNFDNFFKYYGA